MSIHNLNANSCALTTGMCAMLRQQLAPNVEWRAGRKHDDYLISPKINVCDAVPRDEVWMVVDGKVVAKLTNVGELPKGW